MEATNVVLALLFAMVFTNVLDSIFESLPLPLIQLAVGCALGLTALESTLELEPEIFMAIVIAPLLFRESEESDVMRLWRVKKQVFFMAFLLVFITVAGIGFAVHLLIPTLPTAACFALGAILGPTDYVAVASLSSKVRLPDMLITVLKGEALINDASGLISLRFAVAALLTGAFHIVDAGLELAILCVGGFLVGYVLTLIKRIVAGSLRRMMIHNIVPHLLIELSMPLMAYVAAEIIGVSGILAAVTSGVMQSLDFKRTGLFEAELGIAKNTTWEIICFVLNSIVFLMLGMQFPGAVVHIWESPDYNHGFIIAATLLVTLIMMGVRFVSLIFLGSEIIGASLSEKLKNALILTLSGVKGVVSMASAISLPFMLSNGSPFAERPLLIFIAAGAVTLTLLLALFVLPFLVEPSGGREGNENGAQIELLKEVIGQLRRKDGAHLGAVVVSYQKRIKELEHAGYEKGEKKRMRSLLSFAAMTETNSLEWKRRNREISARVYRGYREIMGMMRRAEAGGTVAMTLAGLWRRLAHALRRGGHEREDLSNDEYRQKLRDLFWEETDVVVQALEDMRYLYPEKLIAQFVEERINYMGPLIDDTYAGSLRARLHEEYVKELLVGYEIERETIWDFCDQGRISEEQANELRVNVNKLESYTLSGNRNDAMLRLIALVGDRRGHFR
ncbi:MAG: sodium:proton antiporter [Clostridiales Family XIII bacterium]|jgi:CPA1 family monovalent cation:H+ antiporter|nr:sodium:proton antiporter [Clostridiales Family XIII bacterium]